MSIMYCERHDQRWDSDKLEACPRCEYEPADTADEILTAHDAGTTVYEAAVALMEQEDKCSLARLQRQLGIGHTLASQVAERMEREGIVGPVRKDGTREVLR